jgi:hypothetical protein
VCSSDLTSLSATLCYDAHTLGVSLSFVLRELRAIHSPSGTSIHRRLPINQQNLATGAIFTAH